jgi:UDP-N-acetylglucosamine acyltransferase
VTTVGAHAYLMAYVHIAHNCQVGPHVVMANLASLAGHVEIGEHANIGGMAGIHQFVRIGAHAFVGACSAVLQDIPPYVKVQGNRAKPFGLNVVGLRRHGLSREALQALKEAYRIVFESELNTSQALEQLTIGGGAFPEVQRFVEFIQRSRRGISK